MIVYKRKEEFYIRKIEGKTKIMVKGPFAIMTYNQLTIDERDIIFNRMKESTDFKDEEKLIVSCFI